MKTDCPFLGGQTPPCAQSHAAMGWAAGAGRRARRVVVGHQRVCHPHKAKPNRLLQGCEAPAAHPPHGLVLTNAPHAPPSPWTERGMPSLPAHEHTVPATDSRPLVCYLFWYLEMLPRMRTVSFQKEGAQSAGHPCLSVTTSAGDFVDTLVPVTCRLNPEHSHLPQTSGQRAERINIFNDLDC